jgi:hypothetical protein
MVYHFIFSFQLSCKYTVFINNIAHLRMSPALFCRNNRNESLTDLKARDDSNNCKLNTSTPESIEAGVIDLATFIIDVFVFFKVLC